jgi:hypothetical protein
MFIVTALSPRGEDIILSSSPQEAAHLIANCKRAFAGSTAAPQRETKTTDNKKN